MARGGFIEAVVERAKSKGGGAGDSAKADDGGGGESYDSVRKDALGTLARILDVPEESREDFDKALSELIQACMDDTEAKEPVAEEG